MDSNGALNAFKTEKTHRIEKRGEGGVMRDITFKGTKRKFSGFEGSQVILVRSSGRGMFERG